MSTFFEKQLKRVMPCILIMIISCCIFLINAGAETIIHLEEKKLFGSPEVSTSHPARSVDVDILGDYLREELIKCPDSVDISSFNLAYNETNSQILSDIIWYEAPELFHINGLSMSISNGIITTVIPRYEYSAQEYKKMYNECMIQANIILDGIAGNSNLNDVQKALLIHDRLAVHCEYDKENYNNNSIPSESYSMYGSLVKGVSVCQGYAETYLYLLEKVGIENRLCSSDALYHVWNIVTINGNEYHVDVTWDDPTMDKTGQVLHTNFLRSSDGIYSTKHYAYDYDTTPTDTTYDNYFWQDSETAFQTVGNEIYYIDNEAGALKKYSNKSTLTDLTDTWPASTSGAYWVGNYSRLGSDGTNLYYNLSEDVYKYTISTGKSEKIWSPDLSANVLFRIYGFTYKDGYLICDINDTPNFALYDKKNYQQRYLYQQQSANTLQSISINAVPSKTDYYIGDQLNTDGLQLKLNYSNGSSKYVTSGFTVSGFSSSSAGSKNVTVTYDGFSTSFNVNVKTPTISLDSSNETIEMKDYFILVAKTDPKNVSVRWSTSNDKIAKVSGGEIEAVAIGTATITAEFVYNGYTYKASCKVTVECNHLFTKTIPGKAATCTSTGFTDGTECSVCGTVIKAQQTINKKAHTEITVKGNEATCTENGLTDGKKCSVCETVIVKQETISASGHKWKEATCTTAKTCTVCNATEGKAARHKEATREENRKEATCKNDGSYDLVTYCSVCKTVIKTENKKIPATGNHVYATEIKRVASTCKTAGYVVKACGCGETKTETLSLDADNHENIIVVKAVEPTCTQSGLTDGKKCSVCGTVTVAQQTINKTGHKQATREENRKEATCKNDGLYDLVTYCSVCKTEIKTENKKIPATGNHVYATEIKRVASTCKTAGYVVKACGCGETKTETLSLDADNHENIIVVKAVEPTCTQSGLTDGKKCSVCGTVIKAQQTINKKAHTEITVKGNEATCIENGLTDGKKCSVCGTVIKAQQIINKKAHTEVTVKGKNATCTETGLTEGKKCSACGKVTVVQKEIAKTGHKEVTVRGKDATCTEAGLTAGKKCSVCGTVTVAQQEIAKKSHLTVRIPGKAPTETQTGLTDGEKCRVCGTITKEQQIIPELNHRHDYIQTVTAPTCTEKGYTTYTCRCGDTYKDNYVDASGHKTEIIADKESTCTEPGLTQGEKCTVCGDITVSQEEIPAKGHIEKTVHGKDATCTDAGLTDGIKCFVCDEIIINQEEIAKTGHLEVAIEAKVSTCTETGNEAGTKCSVCDEIIVAPKEIAKLSHTPGEWETVKKPVVGKDGVMNQKCTVCGEIVAEKIIPALDDKPKNAVGDANNDGKISAADARLVLRMAAKIDEYSDEQIAYLDLNNDKKITAADARILLRISAKIESIENYKK